MAGTVVLGAVCSVMARQSKVWSVMVRYGRFVLVGRGMARCGQVRQGMAWQAWSVMEW